MNSRSRIPLTVFLFASFLAARPAAADKPATQPTTQPAVSFLTMGDWGDGGDGQKAVAHQLGAFASHQTVPINAMLLAGDNFYVPLSGIADPAWKNVFENMYDPKLLPMPFYACLGNHDYPNDKYEIEMRYSQVHPESRWKLPALWYTMDFPADHPLVRLFVLDSNKDFMTPEEWTSQIAWLNQEMAQPHDGIWTLAMAHHPLFSNGSHGDTGPLQTAWGPIFKKNNLDFYLCGHDHDLQHLQIPNWHTSFLLVGGGGRKITAMRRDNRGPFSKSTMGFADLQFSADMALITYYDRDGTIEHQFQKSRDGTEKILTNTPSDKPTANPLKAIERGEG